MNIYAAGAIAQGTCGSCLFLNFGTVISWLDDKHQSLHDISRSECDLDSRAPQHLHPTHIVLRILVAHQTEDRQQLQPVELAFAETTAVAREHRLAHLQSDAAKGRSPTSA